MVAFSLNLDHSKKYLVAVSGGSDSMALLDSLFQQGYHVVVAHVNYKKRVSSDRDQTIVEEYCKNHHIKLEILINHETTTGNFQDWARKFRYHFFKQIYNKEKCDALVIAHQKNDYLETYLMKKERLSLADDLGIAKEVNIYQMRVLRPLLDYYKQDLIDYCHQNNVVYGVDETNFSRRYRRNAIRMDKLDTLSKEQLETLFEEAQSANQKRQKERQDIQNLYQSHVHQTQFSFKVFVNMTKTEQHYFLYEYLVQNKLKPRDKISRAYLENLRQTLMSDKPNLSIHFNSKTLLKSYDKCYLYQGEEFHDFEYTFPSTKSFLCPYFEFNTLEGQEFTVKASDFPLKIRNYRLKDQISIGEGHKLVRRFFIDKKVPLEIRKKIPIVLNQANEIIFIPHLYKNKDSNLLQTDRIMLKLKSLT